ncbi:uncharacterized protein LOC128276749, partial [Anopheles cruzii]|uniref:uncharacterized protein LOC128276749 n=1 Tax=Anopheles cruzii TaxID=68878 RepID=UPI0022EC43BF
MYAIVQTTGPKGQKELSVVPKAWLAFSTKFQKPVLRWPTKCTVEQQRQMIRDNRLPETSWSYLQCTVKREFATFAEANVAIDEMSDMSSSSSCQPSTPKKKKTIRQPDYNDEIIAIDQSFSHHRETTITSNQHRMQQSISQASVSATFSPQLKTTENVGGENGLMEKLTDIINRLVRIETQNALIIQEQRLQKENIDGKIERLTNRLDKMDVSLAETIVMLPSIIDKLNVETQAPTFTFEAATSIEQLEELETKLYDEAFLQDMIRWLEWNVIGEKSEKRMNICLDLLLSTDLQCNSTWTGTTINGKDRIGLQQRRNITKLIKSIASTKMEKVNDKIVAKFMINKLRNTKKRLMWSGSKSSHSLVTNVNNVRMANDSLVFDPDVSFIDY